MLLSRFAMMLQPFLAPDDPGAGGNPPAAGAPPTAEPPAPAPGTNPPTPTEFLDFGGRRVPVADPALRDLHGDWQEQQRELTRLRQEYQRTQASLAALVTGQASGQPAQPQGLTPEQVEAFMADFYDRGPAAVEALVDKVISEKFMSKVEPLLAQQEFGQQLNQLATKHDDLAQVAPIMDKLLDLAPELAESDGAMERIYTMAKALANPNNAAPAPSPDQLLDDPEFQKKILAHPGITKQVVSAYLGGKLNQAALPPAPGGAPGGVPPAAPPNSPKTAREAVNAWMASLGGR